MSLPPSPVLRQRLHQRSISYEGHRRDDGLFDIDAYLVDAKDHDFELLTGVRPAREAVHDMWVRVTIDCRFLVSTCMTGTSNSGSFPTQEQA